MGNVLSNPGLQIVSQEIQNAANTLRDAQGDAKVLLVVDQLDLLLAAGGDAFGVVALGEIVMGLREVYALLRVSSQC